MGAHGECQSQEHKLGPHPGCDKSVDRPGQGVGRHVLTCALAGGRSAHKSQRTESILNPPTIVPRAYNGCEHDRKCREVELVGVQTAFDQGCTRPREFGMGPRIVQSVGARAGGARGTAKNPPGLCMRGFACTPTPLPSTPPGPALGTAQAPTSLPRQKQAWTYFQAQLECLGRIVWTEAWRDRLHAMQEATMRLCGLALGFAKNLAQSHAREVVPGDGRIQGREVGRAAPMAGRGPAPGPRTLASVPAPFAAPTSRSAPRFRRASRPPVGRGSGGGGGVWEEDGKGGGVAGLWGSPTATATSPPHGSPAQPTVCAAISGAGDGAAVEATVNCAPRSVLCSVGSVNCRIWPLLPRMSR